jgi:hypothetical protein
MRQTFGWVDPPRHVDLAQEAVEGLGLARGLGRMVFKARVPPSFWSRAA